MGDPKAWLSGQLHPGLHHRRRQLLCRVGCDNVHMGRYLHPGLRRMVPVWYGHPSGHPHAGNRAHGEFRVGGAGCTVHRAAVPMTRCGVFPHPPSSKPNNALSISQNALTRRLNDHGGRWPPYQPVRADSILRTGSHLRRNALRRLKGPGSCPHKPTPRSSDASVSPTRGWPRAWQPVGISARPTDGPGISSARKNLAT